VGKRRRVILGVGAGLLAISAIGLTLNSAWLGGRWQSSQAANALAAKLEALDGVASATAQYQPLGLPNPTVDVSVSFGKNALPQQWGAANALVRKDASSATLRGTTTTAEFGESGAKTHATVQPMLFDPGVVTSEIAAWQSLRAVVGDRVSLNLGASTQSGEPTRAYTVSNSQDMREIAALWPTAPPAFRSALPTSWNAPGIQLNGMPTPAEMASVAAVAKVLPLASGTVGAKQSGTLAVVLGGVRGGFKVEIISIESGNYVNATPDKKMAAAFQAAFAGGAQTVEWMSKTRSVSLINGDCGTYGKFTTKFVATDDTKLFGSQLTDAGFVAPVGVRPGNCEVVS
jgi:hypothetical protein